MTVLPLSNVSLKTKMSTLGGVGKVRATPKSLRPDHPPAMPLTRLTLRANSAAKPETLSSPSTETNCCLCRWAGVLFSTQPIS